MGDRRIREAREARAELVFNTARKRCLERAKNVTRTVRDKHTLKADGSLLKRHVETTTTRKPGYLYSASVTELLNAVILDRLLTERDLSPTAEPQRVELGIEYVEAV